MTGVRYRGVVFVVMKRAARGLGLRVMRASINKPRSLGVGEVCVKMPLSIASEAFEPRLVVPEQSLEVGDVITAEIEKPDAKTT